MDLYPFVLPSIEEMALREKQYRCLEAAQNLKHDLSSLLDRASDGWVPPEHWEAAKIENKANQLGLKVLPEE